MGGGISQTEKPILYGLGGSGNCQKTMLFHQDHCADKVDFKVVDIMKGEQMTEEYLAVNPLHQIPALQVGTEGVIESHAILRYLALTYKPEMYPAATDTMAACRIDQMLEFIGGSYYNDYIVGCGYMYVGYAPMDGEKRTAAAKKLVEVTLPLLEKKLEQTAYIAGDSLSIADYAYIGVATFIMGAPELVAAKDQFPKWAAYEAKLLEEMPACKGGGYQWFLGFCKDKAAEYHKPKEAEEATAEVTAEEALASSASAPAES